MRYQAGLETRERILQATRSLIAKKGLEGTTIKAICASAKVLPGSFYNLFTSKEQAILTVVRETIDAVDPDPEHTGAPSLRELVAAYVAFIEGQGDLASVYIRIAVSGEHNSPDLKGRVLRHHQGRVARFADTLRQESQGLTKARAEKRAETLVSALNGIALHRMLDPTFDVAGHAESLVDDAAFWSQRSSVE